MSGMEMIRDEHNVNMPVSPAQRVHAQAYLMDQPDADMLAEALGLAGYWGRHVDVKRKINRAAWREPIA